MKLTTRDLILAAALDAAGDFMYYSRKEDEDLPRGVIEEAIEDGVITVNEIVDAFRKGMAL